MSGAWTVEHRAGSAGELHGRPLGPSVTRAVTLFDVTAPAIVLGSTQPDADVDASAAAESGSDVVRRRSGGGAVLLMPGQTLWIDVDLPRGDARWDDDVGRAFHWLGRAWVAALDEVGVDGAVHTGGLVATAWSRIVCFGGLGPGEVTVDGRKLVGISQRRTRDGARFQCVVHRTWDPAPLVRMLALDEGQRSLAVDALADAATGLDLDGELVVDSLIRNLP